MTIEIGTQKVGRATRRRAVPKTDALPIGEADANIFACPGCTRPLGTGTARCPGCGTRLVAGVKASRAIAFVGIGVTIGILVSGGTMALTSAISRPAPIVVADTPAVAVAPTQVPVVVKPPAPVVDPGIPSSAVSALRQSTLLNQRVVADAERLSAALAASKPSSAEIAPILRSLASTAAFGARLAPTVGEWDQADAVSSDLAAFYADIGGAARDGLASSLASHRAYVAAGERMLRIVAGLDRIDAATRAVAAAGNLELPPLDKP